MGVPTVGTIGHLHRTEEPEHTKRAPPPGLSDPTPRSTQRTTQGPERLAEGVAKGQSQEPEPASESINPPNRGSLDNRRPGVTDTGRTDRAGPNRAARLQPGPVRADLTAVESSAGPGAVKPAVTETGQARPLPQPSQQVIAGASPVGNTPSGNTVRIFPRRGPSGPSGRRPAGARSRGQLTWVHFKCGHGVTSKRSAGSMWDRREFGALSGQPGWSKANASPHRLRPSRPSGPVTTGSPTGEHVKRQVPGTASGRTGPSEGSSVGPVTLHRGAGPLRVEAGRSATRGPLTPAEGLRRLRRPTHLGAPVTLAHSHRAEQRS
jgi:hypothetical protein